MPIAPPVRIVHLGLGSFFRAHQAWYTDRAPDAHDWGIAAFTGRRSTLADALTAQQGLYTLVTRGHDKDEFSVIRSVAEAHAATDHAAWLRCWQSPDLAVLTLTVTEAGYLLRSNGPLDSSNEQVSGDVAALRSDPSAPVSSVPARLLSGLMARARAGLGRVAVVPCDNLPQNGPVVAEAVRAMAQLVDPRLVEMVDATASFVTTVVDRITPATTRADLNEVHHATGRLDAAPIVTEPFSEWILSGEFPAGRPQWEHVGARFVTDIAPYEQRKLSMLNGAHSLLAYAGSIRGHATVAEAVADPECRAWLHQWWDEAAAHLKFAPAEITTYRSDLLRRFANPRMGHSLAQIAVDGTQKLPVRILPTLRAELAAGRVPTGTARTVAGWICHLRGHGAPINDVDADRATAAATGALTGAVPRVLALLDGDRPDPALAATVAQHVEELTRSAAQPSPENWTEVRT